MQAQTRRNLIVEASNLSNSLIMEAAKLSPHEVEAIAERILDILTELFIEEGADVDG